MGAGDLIACNPISVAADAFQAVVGRSIAAVSTGARNAEQLHQLKIRPAALFAVTGFDSCCRSLFERIRSISHVALKTCIGDTLLDQRKIDVTAARAGHRRFKTAQKATQQGGDDDGGGRTTFHCFPIRCLPLGAASAARLCGRCWCCDVIQITGRTRVRTKPLYTRPAGASQLHPPTHPMRKFHGANERSRFWIPIVHRAKSGQGQRTGIAKTFVIG